MESSPSPRPATDIMRLATIDGRHVAIGGKLHLRSTGFEESGRGAGPRAARGSGWLRCGDPPEQIVGTAAVAACEVSASTLPLDPVEAGRHCGIVERCPGQSLEPLPVSCRVAGARELARGEGGLSHFAEGSCGAAQTPQRCQRRAGAWDRDPPGLEYARPHRADFREQSFQGGNRGSNPLGGTNVYKGFGHPRSFGWLEWHHLGANLGPISRSSVERLARRTVLRTSSNTARSTPHDHGTGGGGSGGKRRRVARRGGRPGRTQALTGQRDESGMGLLIAHDGQAWSPRGSRSMYAGATLDSG